MATCSPPGAGDLNPAGCSTGGRAYFGPTMQPATVAAATITVARPDPLTTGLSGRDRSHDLPLLQRHVRLPHDRVAAMQSGLNLERIAEIPAEHDRLEVECVPPPDSHAPRAVGIGDDGGSRHPP